MSLLFNSQQLTGPFSLCAETGHILANKKEADDHDKCGPCCLSTAIIPWLKIPKVVNLITERKSICIFPLKMKTKKECSCRLCAGALRTGGEE